MKQVDIPDYKYYLGCNAKKNGPLNIPRKKVRISIGNIDLFAYSILKKIDVLLDQGVVHSEPNWYPRLPVLFRL